MNPKQFLELIFKPTDIIEVRCFWPDEKKTGRPRAKTYKKMQRWRQLDGFTAKDWEDLHEVNRLGYGVYFGIGGRNCDGGTTKDVDCCRVLCVDYDIPKEEDHLTHVMERILKAKFMMPTFMNETGHGIHCFWVLDKPIYKAEDWLDLQNRMAAALDSDRVSTNKFAGVMRLPGFKNTKYEGAWDRVWPLCPTVNFLDPQYNPEAVYKFADIDKALPKLAPKSKSKPRTKKGRQFKFTMDFSVLPTKELLLEHGRDVAPQNTLNAWTNCIMESHKNGDENPSFSIGITGDHNAIGSCMTCPLQPDGKKVAYSILEILLVARGKKLEDQKARWNLIHELNDRFPGFLISETIYLDPDTPEKSQTEFCRKYYNHKAQNGEYMMTIFWIDGSPMGFNSDKGVYEPLDKDYLEHTIEMMCIDAKRKVYLKPKKLTVQEIKDSIPERVGEFIYVDFNPNTHKVTEIYNSLKRNHFKAMPKDIIYPHWMTPDPDPNHPRPERERIIVVRSGVLELAGKNYENISLGPVWPDMMNIACSPYDIDPKRLPEYPKLWFDLVEQWLNFDKHEMYEAQKRAGYFAFAGDVTFPIIWQLHGKGGSGRTCYSYPLIQVRGVSNVMDLGAFEMGDEYGLADLPGKGLIHMDNIEWSECRNIGMFNKRVNSMSGRTKVGVRAMRTKSIPYLNRAQQLWCADIPCPYKDPGGQRERRTYYTRFPNHWSTDKRDTTRFSEPDSNLLGKIEKMMPGIIWYYYIPGYINWLKDEGTSRLETSDVLRDDIQRETQPLKSFFIELLGRKNKDAWMTTAMAHSYFQCWAKFHDLEFAQIHGERRTFLQKLYGNVIFFSKHLGLQMGLQKEKDLDTNLMGFPGVELTEAGEKFIEEAAKSPEDF